MTVSARAVAYEGNGPNCIYVMNPSASGAMSANGNVTIDSRCGLLVDSSSSSGLSVNGNSSISATTIGVVGGYSANGNTSFSPTPKTGVIAASRSAGIRAGADGRIMRSHQFFAEREQREQRQSLPALCRHLLRRHLGQRQLGPAFQRGNLRACRWRDAHQWQLDDDRHRDHVLQHDRDRQLRGNHAER